MSPFALEPPYYTPTDIPIASKLFPLTPVPFQLRLHQLLLQCSTMYKTYLVTMRITILFCPLPSLCAPIA
jgi:hypothetical protein